MSIPYNAPTYHSCLIETVCLPWLSGVFCTTKVGLVRDLRKEVQDIARNLDKWWNGHPLDPDSEVIIWKHANYGGDARGFRLHETVTNYNDIHISGTLTDEDWNDKVSSVKVSGSAIFVAWEHANFGGNRLVLMPRASIPELRHVAGGWHDCISSSKVIEPIELDLIFGGSASPTPPLPSANGRFVEDGFYRVNDAGTVWQLYTENGVPMACGVASGEHLANLGGQGRVTALSDVGTGRTWAGTCRVADGFYQVNDQGVVWQLYTESGVPMACGIASADHLSRRGGTGQIKTVPSGAEIGAQRTWTGTCPG